MFVDNPLKFLRQYRPWRDNEGFLATLVALSVDRAVGGRVREETYRGQIVPRGEAVARKGYEMARSSASDPQDKPFYSLRPRPRIDA